ncbi:hypothetical protein SAMN05428967_2254 [Phyllobacterium sp. YR620]|uniref:hypothetical protein n=1 Tax=Phyllobacterium sp. YR620 TaxID=1881066 RepID=UPI00088CD014|nr:hypothetical protein [Phyllobacterium sp. YR620]SDP46819.1 hypothetical protein SAMN05428967_2254 [Phyllobacterium sp. YR620]
MSDAPRTAVPGSLLSQWWTLGDIILDRRTNGSGRHVKVAWVIIDRYMQAKGNGRASVRFIEQATGLSKGIIIKACRELVDWGYMTQRIGIGTRPTEYSPNWSSVSPTSNAKTISPSVPQESNASVPPESNTTDFSVPPESNESYLPEPAYKAGLQVGSNFDTHGAPPSAALSGAAAGTRVPESAFDKFWLAFPRKFQKPKARSAWDKINPSEELAGRIIEAASLWAAHYASQSTDKKWIPTPANWLTGERYDEDLPDVYTDPKEAAIAKANERKPSKPAVAANDNDGLPALPVYQWDVGPFSPFGTFRGEIIDSHVGWPNPKDQQAVFTIELDGREGNTVDHTFFVQAADPKKQERGQQFLRDIMRAVSFEGALDDTDQLHFRPLQVTIDRGLISYAPIEEAA